MPKISRPVVYTLVLGAVAYGVVVLTEPETRPAPKRPAAQAARPASAKGDLFTEQDYRAHFERLSGIPRNAFRPLVARRGPGSPDEARLDALPTSFTGGEANWRYTGNASLNGVRLALIENASTGEGVFLRVGERWKDAVLSAIEEEAIVMVGPFGEVRRIRLGEREIETVPPGPAAGTPVATGLAPVRVGPELTGPIGLSPSPDALASVPGGRPEPETGPEFLESPRD